MTIKDMHYDFKKKLNKIDSQQNRNLRVPEIDWTLNEAQELFVKMIAFPRASRHLGLEVSQRTIDDIRTIVVEDECISVGEDGNVTLPENYLHLVTGRALMSKGDCEDVKSRPILVRRHNEEFQDSVFDISSFEWREVNAVFHEDGIRVFDDGTFTITKLCIDYIRKFKYIHNAEDFRAGTYNLPSGQTLTGHQNSELPESTHREIVDLAVMIASGELQLTSFNFHQAKSSMNQLQ